MGGGWQEHRLIIKILVYLEYIKNSLIYFLVFLSLLLLTLYLSGADLTMENIALFLTLNKEPANAFEAIALILIFFMELSPLMAFVELRTLNPLDKLEILAKKMRNHVVVVGVGHLGSRIVDRLEYMDIPYVVITLPSDLENNEKVMKLIELGKPVILGDASLEIILRKANIEKAAAIILAVNNDMLNSRIAEKAKKLNPKVKTVVRIYNDDFAEILEKSGYADEIISTTAIAVDRYILGAFMDIIKPEFEPVLINVTPELGFHNKKVGGIEKERGIEVISIKRNRKWLKINKDTVVKLGDKILITGPPSKLGTLLENVLGQAKT
ncbi:MAG: potassium channel family protein [Candidatus Njordarchaeia archaeon]